ncbi:MAG: beta strand repeat-containing protein [Terriglobales bacterium]
MAKFLRCLPLIVLGVMTACGGGGISNNSGNTGGGSKAAVLQSIAVTANNPSFPAGLTQQFTASGSYSDGTSKDLTSSVTWSSSNSRVATISATGVAKGVSAGSCTITATETSISGTASLMVGPPALTSITISSVAPSVAAGLTDQFTATGNYTDGSTQNLTSSVTWTVSNGSVASISSSGLASAKSNGSAVITAAMGSISGTSSLTVGSPLLVSISVNPASPSVGVGLTDQVTATGNYTDGSAQNLSSSVTWSVSNSALATISSGGLLNAISNGSATVTATSGSITGTAPLTITISLVSISVTPALPMIAPGTAQQFRATGTFTDNSTQDITSSVTWNSSDTTKATIITSGPTSGLVHALATGSSTIMASSGSISGSTTLTVSHGKLTSIAVTPANSTIPLGIIQQFTATGTFDDGTTQDITNTVTWSSSQPSLVSITVSGAATALNLGTVTITATANTITGSTALTINAANLNSLSIQPLNPTIAAGTTSKLSAIGLFSDGSTRDVSIQSAWISSTPGVATVASNGKLQGISAGQSTVTATLGSQTTSVTVTVSSATAVSISITPSISSVAPGTQVTFAATGLFTDSTTQVISSNVTWSSSDTTVATVGNSGGTRGIATAVGTGSAIISATFEGASGTAQMNVSGANLTGVTVNPASAVIAPASTQQYTAIATYDDGTSQNVSTIVTWSSSDTSVATVTAFGQATGQSSGTATIEADFGGASSTTTLLVESSGALTSIALNPSSATIPEQIIAPFTALGTFADNSQQDLTSVVTWTSSKASAATVSNVAGFRGFVTGVAPGSSTISAVFAGHAGTAPVAVTNATLISISIAPANPVITLGTGRTFTAMGIFSDGSAVNLSTQVAWSSSDVRVAVINANGQATSAGSGTTTITATLNGVSADTTLTVN